MFDWLIPAYLWIKALHIVFVIAWMAGLFYLPRLFVYHADVENGSAQDELFQLMERRLLRVIMNPAMIGAWVFGVALLLTPSVAQWGALWIWVKGLSVIVMTAFHMALSKWRRGFEAGRNERGAAFYRKANEIPTILMIAIVFMVVLKPL